MADFEGKCAILAERNPFIKPTLDLIARLKGQQWNAKDSWWAQKNTAREKRMEAEGEKARFMQRVAQLRVVEDIDPATGQRLAIPARVDENGNDIIGSSMLDGREYVLRSAIVDHDRRIKVARDEELRLTKLAQESPLSFDRLTLACTDFLVAWDASVPMRKADLKPPKGVTVEEHSKLGQLTMKLAKQLDDTINAYDTRENALADVDAWVATFAEPPVKWRPADPRLRSAGGLRRPSTITFAMAPVRGAESARVGIAPTAGDLEAFAMWAHGDAVASEIRRQVNDFYDHLDRPAMSADQRRNAVAKLRAELHNVELREAQMLWALIERGVDVQPRQGISPKALLLIA